MPLDLEPSSDVVQPAGLRFENMEFQAFFVARQERFTAIERRRYEGKHLVVKLLGKNLP